MEAQVKNHQWNSDLLSVDIGGQEMVAILERDDN